MSKGTFALLGAFDACCLCCVCAGVCAAVTLTASASSEVSATRRAVGINLGLGDYVEACYPYLEKSTGVNAAAYLGAAMAGAALLAAGDEGAPPRSSAYLPLPLAVAVSDQPVSFARAAAIAFFVPFLGSLLAFKAAKTTERP